jgi:hypothetical protein
MRKTVEFMVALACLCLPASAQTPAACRTALNHLTLPQTAQIDDGNGETPLEFLFSDHGADIYSAIPSSEPNYVTWFISNGIRFIVVYQEEQARQQAIHNLSQPNVVARVMTGSSRHSSLDEMKFAVVHLGIGSSRDKPDEAYIRANHPAKEAYYHELLTAGWHIEDIKYFEPQACETYTPRDLCVNKSGQAVPCVSPGLHASDVSANWITDLNVPHDKKLEPYDDPQFVKTIEAMRVKLKAYTARNQDH